jgi:hypothetical protein
VFVLHKLLHNPRQVFEQQKNWRPLVAPLIVAIARNELIGWSHHPLGLRAVQEP